MAHTLMMHDIQSVEIVDRDHHGSSDCHGYNATGIWIKMKEGADFEITLFSDDGNPIKITDNRAGK